MFLTMMLDQVVGGRGIEAGINANEQGLVVPTLVIETADGTTKTKFIYEDDDEARPGWVEIEEVSIR